mgnify:CR=1 FL=1
MFAGLVVTVSAFESEEEEEVFDVAKEVFVLDIGATVLIVSTPPSVSMHSSSSLLSSVDDVITDVEPESSAFSLDADREVEDKEDEKLPVRFTETAIEDVSPLRRLDSQLTVVVGFALELRAMDDPVFEEEVPFSLLLLAISSSVVEVCVTAFDVVVFVVPAPVVVTSPSVSIHSSLSSSSSNEEAEALAVLEDSEPAAVSVDNIDDKKSWVELLVESDSEDAPLIETDDRLLVTLLVLEVDETETLDEVVSVPSSPARRLESQFTAVVDEPDKLLLASDCSLLESVGCAEELVVVEMRAVVWVVVAVVRVGIVSPEEYKPPSSSTHSSSSSSSTDMEEEEVASEDDALEEMFEDEAAVTLDAEFPSKNPNKSNPPVFELVLETGFVVVARLSVVVVLEI